MGHDARKLRRFPQNSATYSVCFTEIYRDQKSLPGAAFFGKEDTVVTDLSSIARGDIRSRFLVVPLAALWFRARAGRSCFWSTDHHRTASRDGRCAESM